MIARQEGMSFLQLIAGIVASAAARLGLHAGPAAPEGTDRG
jgi:hypothetical protein